MNEISSFLTNIQTTCIHEYILSFCKRSCQEILQIYVREYQEKILSLIAFGSCLKCIKASKGGKISIQCRQISNQLEFPKPLANTEKLP